MRAMRGRRFDLKLKDKRLGWIVWGSFFAGTVVILAWQFGWFPVGYESAESGRLASIAPTEPDEADAAIPAFGPPPADQSEPVVVIAQPPRDESERRDAESPFLDFEPRIRSNRAPGAADEPHSSAHFIRDPNADDFARPVAGERGAARSRPGVWRDAAEFADAGIPSARPEIARSESGAQERAGGSGQPVSRPELAEIDRMIDRGDYVPAHRLLTDIHWSRPDLRPQIRERIETTAGSIFFAAEPHYLEPYVVQPGDLLSRIGKQYDVPWEYLVRLNRVDPRRIRPGQKLKVVRGPFHATVDLGDFELTVHTQDMFVKRYAVGIGKDASTPVGRFTVLGKVKNPQYTDPQTRVVVDGNDPANPLGKRWIDLGESYGIHGTIDPSSIGKAASRGCIRMRAEDIEEVFDMLQADSVVVIRE